MARMNELRRKQSELAASIEAAKAEKAQQMAQAEMALEKIQHSARSMLRRKTVVLAPHDVNSLRVQSKTLMTTNEQDRLAAAEATGATVVPGT